MRVYKDPDRPGYVIAVEDRARVIVHRDALPANVGEALEILRNHLAQALAPLIDPDTGQPIEPPPPLEPEATLDIDDEAVQWRDFDDLAGKIAGEITWLETVIPTISDPTLRRIAQHDHAMLKAWRYLIRRVG